MIERRLNTRSVDSYREFLAIKQLPQYRIVGRLASFQDEYAALVGLERAKVAPLRYRPSDQLYDYQAAISRLAIRKERFACFVECGLGKTLILLEFARHALKNLGKRPVLIVSPIMVINQTIAEAKRFYPDMEITRVPARDLQSFLDSGTGIGITNYEAITDDLRPSKVGAIIADESSCLKSHYGKWGTKLIELGRGVRWKLALTGTPAPNDRIEYANHAVFLDRFPTVNSFLARYFVNRGQTDNRWELKPHALEAFYRDLSDWAIFVTNPATYGWVDNVGTVPPIHVHIHDIELTDEQSEAVRRENGDLFGTPGGITSRSRLAQIAKGNCGGESYETRKPEYIRQLVESWPDESTLIWCLYNEEQKSIERALPWAASMSGDTPFEERDRIIADFKAGRVKAVITKTKVMGFGLNLQIATRQVFSGLQDSYESFHQAVKRSNRIGSTRPLNVHIPVTNVEYPMIQTVLQKAKRVDQDTQEQERIFKECRLAY